jgi:hypothetical protein
VTIATLPAWTSGEAFALRRPIPTPALGLN